MDAEVREKEHIDKPRYRVSYETSADSPEALHRKMKRGLRHIMRKGRRNRR